MKTHPVALMIRPDGEGILSERATTVKLDDEDPWLSGDDMMGSSG